MNKRWKYYFVALTLLLQFCGNDAASQCSSATGAVYKGTIVPTTNFQSLSGVSAGDYWDFYGASCSTYVFSFCPADGGSVSWNTQLTVNDNSGTANTGGFNDDYCSSRSYLEWTPDADNTYRIYVTKSNCQNSGGTSGTLVYKVVALNTVTSEYALVGNAIAPSGCATLTENSSNEQGCAWDVNSTLDFSASFSYDFTINLGTNDGGADGLSFVIQNDPLGLCACGTAGGGMGAGGISNSMIIELDTYLNYEDRDDGITGVVCLGGPDPDHIDLWLNGNVNPTGTCGSFPGARIIPSAVALMNGASTYNIENGVDHTLRISWIPSGASGTLTVSVLDINGLTAYATFSYSFSPLTVFGTETPYYGFTASTGALSNQQAACISPVLLPVDLASWIATCSQNKEVLLQWKTVSELHNQYFSIERSDDGIHFGEIMKIDGAGTSYDSHQYSWTDVNPLSGISYYRLAHVADNGDKKYSPAVSITCNVANNPSLSVFLDGSGFLTISFEGTTPSDGTVHVIDINGKVRAALPVKIQADAINSPLQIYAGMLPDGIYLVTLQTHAQFYCTKVVVF